MMSKKPNYYINAVNALSYPIADGLIAGEMGLYITIVLKFNRFGWKKKVVGIKNVELVASAGISEKTVDKYRQNLVDIGLLEVKIGSRGRSTEYKLPYSEKIDQTFSSSNSSSNSSQSEDELENNPTFSSSNSNQKEIDRRNDPTFSSQNSCTHKIEDKRLLYNKHHEDFEKNNFEEEISENENLENPIVEESEISELQTEISPSKKVAPKKVSKKSKESEIDTLDLPFASEEFKMIWNEFRTYRKSEKKNAVTITSAKRILKKLVQYDESTAITAFDEAMEKGWLGIFPENVIKRNTPKNNLKPKNLDFENADYSRTTLK